jgi:hypothetical protein
MTLGWVVTGQKTGNLWPLKCEKKRFRIPLGKELNM